MLFGTVQVYHLLRNRNGSGVTEEAAENSKATVKYKPILANFWTDDDGVEWFTSHDFIVNQDGQVDYIERQVGCFTSEQPRIVHDDEYDKDYLEAECAIPREYTHAADIIQRQGGTKGSVELLVNACSYNAKEKYLELTDIEVSGYTLLGKNPDTGEFVQEGMVGSKLQLKDFAADNTPSAMFSDEQENILINTLNSLNETLKGFNNSDRKEENVVKKKNLNDVENENLKLGFDGEGGDGGDTPSGDTPAGDTTTGDTTTGDTTGSENTGGDNTGGNTAGGNNDGDGNGESGTQTEEPSADQTAANAVAETISALTDESTAEAVEAARAAYDGLTETQQGLVSSEAVAALEAQEARIAAADDDDDEDGDDDNSSTDLGKKRKNNSLSREMSRDGLSLAVNFEVSHEDIRYALYNLISSWDEEDNDWYMIEKVYDGKFIARGFWTDQIWGSKYTVDGDAVNLDGDRYALHVEYLTDDEQAQLNNMRSNYSELQDKVSKYELAELNAQRDEILNSEKYAEYQDVDRFKELREHKEDYSLEDLRTQCELAFAAQFDVASGQPQKQTFAEEPKKEPKKSPKMFAFLHVEENSNEFLNGLMGRK